MSVSTVVHRSAAEMPVVVPCLASTDTVKAVRWASAVSLPGTTRGSCSASRRHPSIGRQMTPLVCRIMNAIFSGVILSAAMMRSPSFSRSVSSSTTTTNSPRRTASMARSTCVNGITRSLRSKMSSPGVLAPAGRGRSRAAHRPRAASRRQVRNGPRPPGSAGPRSANPGSALRAQHERRDVRNQALHVATGQERAGQRAAAFDERVQHTLASEQREHLVEVDADAAAPGSDHRDLRPRGAPRINGPGRRRLGGDDERRREREVEQRPGRGTRPRASRRTRNGARNGAGGWAVRTVSAGRSASAVPAPTTIACASARSPWASARAISEVIHCDVPSAAATRPSRLVASLSVANARPVRR